MSGSTGDWLISWVFANLSPAATVLIADGDYLCSNWENYYIRRYLSVVPTTDPLLALLGSFKFFMIGPVFVFCSCMLTLNQGEFIGFVLFFLLSLDPRCILVLPSYSNHWLRKERLNASHHAQRFRKLHLIQNAAPIHAHDTRTDPITKSKDEYGWTTGLGGIFIKLSMRSDARDRRQLWWMKQCKISATKFLSNCDITQDKTIVIWHTPGCHLNVRTLTHSGERQLQDKVDK